MKDNKNDVVVNVKKEMVVGTGGSDSSRVSGMLGIEKKEKDGITKSGQIKNEVEAVIDKQRAFFKTGITKDITFRIDALGKLKKSISRHEGEILEALTLDLGRHPVETYAAEIGLLYHAIDMMIECLPEWAAVERVKTPSVFFPSQGWIEPEPYGNVLIISPWNYPLLLSLEPLAGAIAAGNTVILKTSEYAQATSSVISRILGDCFDSSYVAAVTGDAGFSSQLLSYNFDYIFFTGSTRVGKIVMEAAAKHLTPVTLELGGKSPCIATEISNIATAGRRIAWGKCFNAGQTCVAPDYLLVHKEIKSQMVESIKKSITDFYTENPLSSPNYCRIINRNHFERLLKLLGDGKVIYGGRFDGELLKIEPTLIEDVDMDSPLMQDEIFGPLLPVIPFDSLSDALEIITRRPKPLALYIFTDSKNIIKRILKETSSGGVCINDTLVHLSCAGLPFGGVGDSGMGQYHGRNTFETFVHRKGVLQRGMFPDLRLRYPPYDGKMMFIRGAYRWLMD